MSVFNGRVIKKAYMHKYVTSVSPEPYIDEDGMEVKQIASGPKDMRYFLVLDQRFNMYIIPAKYDEQRANWVKAYEIEDIVSAADGDLDIKIKIKSFKCQLRREFCNENLFSESWTQEAYKSTLPTFINQYNVKLKEKGFDLVAEDDFPTQARTELNLTQEEITEIVENSVMPVNT